MKRSAFTLVEMLIVIAIAGILMTMILGTFSQARYLAKRAKADGQLRELITAWHEYFILYGKWPADVRGRDDVEMTYSKLDALIDKDSADNPRKLILLNVTLKSEMPNEPYKDPWGNVYKVSFKPPVTSDPDETALRLSVQFPNRKRRMMY